MMPLSKYGTEFLARRLNREMERLFMDKDDICNEVDGNRQAVSGEREFEQEGQKDDCHFVECSYGKFYRSFTLSAAVQADKSDAAYKDGVPEVNLLKKEEVKPKKVTVK